MSTGETHNLGIPQALMTQVEEVARIEQRSPDDVVREAVERFLRLKQREALYAFGEAQAENLGIREHDVTDLVHQLRGVSIRDQ